MRKMTAGFEQKRLPRITSGALVTVLLVSSLPNAGFTQPKGGSQATTGQCSPNINGVNGPVTTVCNLTIATLRATASSNLENCIAELSVVNASNSYYLLPSFRTYRNDPSPEHWEAVKADVAASRLRLKAAIDSALIYDASLSEKLGPDLRPLHAVLHDRAIILATVPEQPPDANWTDNFMRDYASLMVRLKAQLEGLRGALLASKGT
ncbi:hypothetical protein BSFA1_88820 (plasmid) [Burkholderia sp. SFA1]|nr:hypothetical protein BSFA1_88820 [Burkholderia sp. SFA1]